MISLFHHICAPSFQRWLPSLRMSRLDVSTLVSVCFVWPDRGYLSRPSRMLVGALKGEQVLLFSELARWYLQQGLVITRIYQLLQYKRGKPFQSFGESVSAARREGDSDTAKSVIADTATLVGNSCFGKTIVDKDRHRGVLYVDGHAAASKCLHGFVCSFASGGET